MAMDGLEPELSIGILTGSGRAFCTSADMRQWVTSSEQEQGMLPADGFCGISQRHGKKPILAAVNGLAVGGGMEVLINCDMVIASPSAVLSLPDVKVGLSLLGGTLPLLVRKIGRSRASDMVFTGRNIRADEALRWGLVDRIVEDPMNEAVEIAKTIAGNSPDAVFVSREGIFMGLTEGDVFEKGREWKKKYWPALRDGKNVGEGISAFLERRKPNWDRDWDKSKL
ncbi:Mevalonyl-coenzyme A Hydratase sidH [Hyphodiscus hymeniophilus]|uniref:Mevalonyl-coenzyme A Hydratase sidH n=1 Tax=Hyphodiscus hymeniophilus TaxID=353542 RepID=A0A9P7AX49_9HELO|nr:Mevalonyl-coenzyme A Hydratase sidH [Hyphodiscus hymeniophilus]